jgi:DNA-binding NtrC family response regulator
VVVLTDRPDPASRLGPFALVLEELRVELVYADTPAQATALLFRNRSAPQAIAVEAHDGDAPERVEQMVGKLVTTLPFLAPVVICSDPDAQTAIRAFRAGAADIIDLTREDRDGILLAIERMIRDHHRRSGKTEQEGELRSVLDEFLRELVHTERRAMDLENELASAEIDPVLDSRRQPVIVIASADRALGDVMTDRLEDSGLVVYSFTSGEEAVRQARALAEQAEPIDIVVVDQELPRMTGLETISAMRDSLPSAPFFLMTARSSGELAAAAADLGVAGYIIKPIEDLAGLVNRLRETAIQSQSRTREQVYLERIKERHQSVLQRYRALTIDAGLPGTSDPDADET